MLKPRFWCSSITWMLVVGIAILLFVCDDDGYDYVGGVSIEVVCPIQQMLTYASFG